MILATDLEQGEDNPPAEMNLPEPEEAWTDVTRVCHMCGTRVELGRYRVGELILSGWKCCQGIELPASEQARGRRWVRDRKMDVEF